MPISMAWHNENHKHPVAILPSRQSTDVMARASTMRLAGEMTGKTSCQEIERKFDQVSRKCQEIWSFRAINQFLEFF